MIVIICLIIWGAMFIWVFKHFDTIIEDKIEQCVKKLFKIYINKIEYYQKMLQEDDLK